MRRLLRLGLVAALAALLLQAIRAMTRKEDPLPDPAAITGSGPWPPLRVDDETAPPPLAEVVAPAEPAPTTPAPDTEEPSDSGVAPVASDDAVEPADDAGPTWVEPLDDGSCPTSHPLKANLSSKIFHAPGQTHYDRTEPDRCYAAAADAEADGLRAAKR